MADFSANELFDNLQRFKGKYVRDEKQGRENDTDLLREMASLFDLDLRFTFQPVREATLDIGFHLPNRD
jgi:hypothetical protein